MKKRTKIFVIIGCIGVILIGLSFYLQERRYGFKLYTDGAKRFELLVPVQWEMKKNVSGAAVIFLSPKAGELDIFQENLSVIVQELKDNKPRMIQEYSYRAVQQIVGVFKENVDILENDPLVLLSGREGHKFVFVGKGPQMNFKYMMYWTMLPREGLAYQISYAGEESQFDQYIEEAEKMIESFKILP